MPSPFRRSLPIAGVAVLMTAALALADPPAGAAPHVRPESVETRALLSELVTRSAAAQRLVAVLDDSEVVVYVRHLVFTDPTLNGRIGLVRSIQPTDYLIVEIACGRPMLEQLVALGHELQHAAEIASAGRALDAPSLAACYERIGENTSVSRSARTYETRAARDVSAQVRRELLGTNMRSTHERE